MFLRRPFFLGRMLGLFLLLGGLLLGFSAAYRAGQMRGYMMGTMTAYQQTAPRGESASPEMPMPFYGRGYDGYSGWGTRPHFGAFLFPFLCLLPWGSSSWAAFSSGDAGITANTALWVAPGDITPAKPTSGADTPGLAKAPLTRTNPSKKPKKQKQGYTEGHRGKNTEIHRGKTNTS
ncbi:MAG: hypothetical protein IPL78_03760 [Chloroflexi bacterium]|nr:hypothetical protein [Chloroflexota bacterium]